MRWAEHSGQLDGVSGDRLWRPSSFTTPLAALDRCPPSGQQIL